MENNNERFAEYLGVEFDVPFKCLDRDENLIITRHGVGHYNSNGTVVYNNSLVLLLVNGKIKPAFNPKEGDTVFLLDPLSEYGIDDRTYLAKNDNWLWKQDRIYRTAEEAREVARKLGWFNERA